MAYTTPDEVREVVSFGGASDTKSASGATDAQITTAIEDAKVEIDARLAVRYPTPFDDPDDPEMHPVPAVVSRINRDMAAYLATLTFLRGAPLAPESPVALRNAQAMRLLNDIATDKVTLTLPGGLPAEQEQDNVAGGAVAVNPYDGEMFTAREYGIFPAIGREGFQLGRPFPEDTY